MSDAGRPRKTDQQKLLEGTYRKDRARQTPKFKTIAGVPDPPMHLDDLAKDEWVHMIQELKAIGILQTVDLLPLAMYCSEMSLYWKCQEKLKNGVTNINPSSGIATRKPEVSIASQALNNAMKIAGRFGFTPADREKLSAINKDPDSDPFTDVLE